MGSFQVIPVVDLRGGAVVHARAGARERYRPLRTPLCAGSDPADVARALVALTGARTLYAADLDAITGTGDNTPALRRVAAALPGVDLWVDAGGRPVPGTPVIGSEWLSDPASLADAGPGVVLSLDLRGERALGPPELMGEPARWPGRVIVMALARVGTCAGPDLARLGQVVARAGGRRVYAAGGVRDAADLARVAALGCAGALVATALHTGRLTPAEIADLSAGAETGGRG